LKLEPLPLDWEENYKFIDKIVGWTIPKEFIPAIEKWVKETLVKWLIAWYPIINVATTVFDGSYHEVDSSEISFKIAAYSAFKNAFKSWKGYILEPVMDVEVVTPDEYVWDIMWDLSSRRGKIQGQEQKNNATTIKVKVPLSEMFWYATIIRSMSQWRANYVMQFFAYEKAPANVAKEIIEARKWTFRWLDE
jgi:elongation factor G